MLAPVMAGANVWGRLVLVPQADPSPHQRMILERGAVALTLNRLLEGNRETAERHAHRSTLSDIIAHRYPSAREMHARTAALGVPTAKHELVAVVVEATSNNGTSPWVSGTSDSADLAADIVAEAARAAGVPALVAGLAPTRIGALLALPAAGTRASALHRLTTKLQERERALPDVVVGVGCTVRDLADVQLSFAEAQQVAHAARGSSLVKPYYELADIQLRGLLHILGEDPRVQAFVERTLGPLLEHDARHGTDLLGTLRGFLASGGNKSAAASAVHLSRQALYERLATVERVLGVDVDSAEVRASLFAALMGLESGRQDPR
jgi:purine catabolism regulator